MLELSRAINNNYISKPPKQLGSDPDPKSSSQASPTHLPLSMGALLRLALLFTLRLFLFSSQTVTGLGSDAVIHYLTAIFLNISSLHLKLSSSSVFI